MTNPGTAISWKKGNDTAEAICSALFQSDFQFLGESDGDRITWFHRGFFPKDVRVQVVRPLEVNMLQVLIEFRVLDPILGAKIGVKRIEIDLDAPNDALLAASTSAVVAVLKCFKSVLAGEEVR